jgi:hypothetical protein
MIPKKPALDLVGLGCRVQNKIMPEQKSPPLAGVA